MNKIVFLLFLTAVTTSATLLFKQKLLGLSHHHGGGRECSTCNQGYYTGSIVESRHGNRNFQNHGYGGHHASAGISGFGHGGSQVYTNNGNSGQYGGRSSPCGSSGCAVNIGYDQRGHKSSNYGYSNGQHSSAGDHFSSRRTGYDSSVSQESSEENVGDSGHQKIFSGKNSGQSTTGNCGRTGCKRRNHGQGNFGHVSKSSSGSNSFSSASSSSFSSQSNSANTNNDCFQCQTGNGENSFPVEHAQQTGAFAEASASSSSYNKPSA